MLVCFCLVLLAFLLTFTLNTHIHRKARRIFGWYWCCWNDVAHKVYMLNVCRCFLQSSYRVFKYTKRAKETQQRRIYRHFLPSHRSSSRPRNSKWIISIWCFSNFSTSYKQVRLSACIQVWVLLRASSKKIIAIDGTKHTCANNKQNFIFYAMVAINHFY